ncbi:hypothetical protein BI364_05315 [Acidihalobacter yilgarnensis]|uniref:Glycosyl transferase family 1 n=1 Tax=Acidihalobacter yilgarnensis TaxID=2819280 RepID=A0A1D8ILZ0_9GAMM|nr:glycosyltransferase family 4 protein [Acidihalobacter yilgarnensis]AOU97469.1 hypothetical protein BI364_05315 [Acidihalobacter yilgarnensis]
MALPASPRIALIRQRYTRFGGAERFVAGALEALVARGARLSVITRRWQHQPGVETIGVNPFHLGRVWRDWAFARAACRVVDARGFDLVQSHERIACCDVYRAGDGVHRVWLQRRAAAGGWRARFGQWLSPYHHYVLHAERRLFESPRLKAVICNSAMVRDEISACFGVPEARIEVIYNAVDSEYFTPILRTRYRQEMRERLGVPESAMVYLFVGSGFARKGLDTAIRALAALPSHCCLVVVGKDRATPRYRRLARKLGLASRVYFAGPQADTAPFYGMADALVLPTLYDPFPNVVLEALACGLPVLISDSCGAVDIIRDGENGFICAARDLEGLIARMRRLMDAELRDHLMPVSRALVESWQAEAMSARLLGLYRRLLKHEDEITDKVHARIPLE